MRKLTYLECGIFAHGFARARCDDCGHDYFVAFIFHPARRYCARPPFAMDRLRNEGADLVYRCTKQRSEPTGDKRGAKVDELVLMSLELIDRIAVEVTRPANF